MATSALAQPAQSQPEPAPVPTQARRSRRRGSTLEDALLRAAWEELSAAVAYASFTMEGVAARAGTSKAVLYRRWANRAELAHAAMRRHMGSLSSQVPDTGALREDILAVLRTGRRRTEELRPEVLTGLMSELHDMPEEAAEAVPRVMMAVLRHAAERGEVDLQKVTPRIATLPFDLLRYEFLVTRAPASEAFLAEIVDDIFLPLVLSSLPG